MPTIMTPETAPHQDHPDPAARPNLRRRLSEAITRRAVLAMTGDEGMSTTEYSMIHY